MRLRSLLGLLLLALPASALAASNLCTTQRCLIYASSDTDLYQVDPATLALSHQCTFAGLADAGVPVTDIAVASGGALYGVTEKALYTIDPASCATTQVATLSTTTTKWVCLAFTASGTLVAAANTGEVATIDPTSGTVTPAGNFSGYGCSGDIIAIDDAAQTIYATATDPTCVGTTCDDLLVTLDPANGYAATVVGHIGARGVFGLGYWASNIYGYTHSGAQLKIDPATGNGTRITQTNPVVKFSGGATTPLAPTCQNLCPSGGATQCVGTAVQTCQLQPSGCLDWVTGACGANQTCSGGACVAACTSECAAGQLGCSGNTTQSCAQGSDGCWHWVNGAACGAHQVCSSGACSTTCTDACTAGATQCAGQLAQTCTVQSSGCTAWTTATDCGAALCVGGACCGCVEGAGQCTARGDLETCGPPAHAGACPSWTTQACASGACDQATCLTRCDADAGFTGCGPTASCITTPTGTFCGTALPDGGWVPSATSGTTTSGSSGSSSGSVGSSSGSSGASTGSSGSGSTSTTGSSGSSGSSTASSGSGSGSGSGTTATSGAGNGGSSGKAIVRPDGRSSKTGCGCGAGAPMELSSVVLALMGLSSARRRRRA